jgi:hypothetical protein
MKTSRDRPHDFRYLEGARREIFVAKTAILALNNIVSSSDFISRI